LSNIGQVCKSQNIFFFQTFTNVKTNQLKLYKVSSFRLKSKADVKKNHLITENNLTGSKSLSKPLMYSNLP